MCQTITFRLTSHKKRLVAVELLAKEFLQVGTATKPIVTAEYGAIRVTVFKDMDAREITGTWEVLTSCLRVTDTMPVLFTSQRKLRVAF